MILYYIDGYLNVNTALFYISSFNFVSCYLKIELFAKTVNGSDIGIAIPNHVFQRLPQMIDFLLITRKPQLFVTLFT